MELERIAVLSIVLVGIPLGAWHFAAALRHGFAAVQAARQPVDWRQPGAAELPPEARAERHLCVRRGLLAIACWAGSLLVVLAIGG